MKIRILLLLASIPASLPAQQPHSTQIDSLMTALYNRGQFTGSILVAQHDQVIYEKAFGLADREKKTPFTLQWMQAFGSKRKSKKLGSTPPYPAIAPFIKQIPPTTTAQRTY